MKHMAKCVRTIVLCGTMAALLAAGWVQDAPTGPYDWRGAGPVAVMSQVYESVGYPSHQATEMATAWREAWHTDGDGDGDGEPASEFDWENANIYAAIIDALQFAGFPEPVIAAQAAEAMEELGIGSVEPNEGDAACLAYKVTVIYCDQASARKLKTTKIMDAACWEELTLCPVDPACGPGEFRWYTVTMTDDCGGSLAGKCIWIGGRTVFLEVDCEQVDFGCECLVEATPGPGIDCASVEKECGEERKGPPGCPDCG